MVTASPACSERQGRRHLPRHGGVANRGGMQSGTCWAAGRFGWDCGAAPKPPARRAPAPGLAPAALEERCHLCEEALVVGAALATLGRLGLECLQQFALPRRQVLRRLDRDLDEHITARRAAQDREPLAAQAELIRSLRSGGDLYLRPRPVEHRYLDLVTQCRLGH